MTVNPELRPDLRPAGYAALILRYHLEVIPNWHSSFVAESGGRRIEQTGSTVREVFPAAYWPGEDLGNHLEFALKYDGTNLGILAALSSAIDSTALTAYVESRRTGKYARRLWFLYELLTGTRLPLDDITRVSYVDLLEPKVYYTADSPRQVRRQRIRDNLLGDRRFCPTVRRTETLCSFEATDFGKRCEEVTAAYSPELLKRALSYLYTKETKSSFEMEHVRPNASRTERFITLLQTAEREDFCAKDRLIDLQNRIVDPRFREDDYRTTQNYVGEAVAWRQERIHFACPKPQDLAKLMEGLIAAHRRMEGAGVCPVVHAASIAYGFVFLHPFEDGNGRIHRFLIHNILARRGFIPPGIMFPISAAMLKDRVAYDASLEAFSRELMTLVDYELDDVGHMTIRNETADWYRFIDMTTQVEALFAFIERTIRTELVEELSFLESYDRTRKAIQAYVDMPDRQIDLLIKVCLDHHGRLSARKRASHFSFLTDEEVRRLEDIIRREGGMTDDGGSRNGPG